MSEKSIQNNPSDNLLIAVLPSRDYKRLLSKSDLTELHLGEIIYEPDDIIRDVYFPNSGIISLLSMIDPGSMLEIGIVGKEGMVGLPAFLGEDRSTTQTIVQGTGMFLRMDTTVFLEECKRSNIFFRCLQRYTHFLMAQISQTAVCNQFHQVKARLARWLLMTHDRLEVGEFNLTQEFLSNMLGVRREAVTLAASNLQQKQIISYSRGKIKVLDRKRLESSSCKCYAIIKSKEQTIVL